MTKYMSNKMLVSCCAIKI